MRTITYWEYEPEDWECCFAPRFIVAWMLHKAAAAKEFNWLVKHRTLPTAKLTSGECLRALRLIMPRKKGTPNNDTGVGRFSDSSKMQRNELLWLNIRLEPTDIRELEQSTSTFEFLAASLCSLASDGIGFSVKPIDRGESYCCTLIGSDNSGSGNTYGMSSFGGELRDTLLVAMYKFDIHMEGSFDNAATFATAAKSKQRFR